jgi:hypothetical protein
VSTYVLNFASVWLCSRTRGCRARCLYGPPTLSPALHADNRLTHLGLGQLLSLTKGEVLQRIDLSGNVQLGEKGAGLLSAFVSKAEALTWLSLEGVGLGDRAFVRLCAAVGAGELDEETGVVTGQCPLRHWNVARNGLTDASMPALAACLTKTQALASLDLSWNREQIASPGFTVVVHSRSTPGPEHTFFPPHRRKPCPSSDLSHPIPPFVPLTP